MFRRALVRFRRVHPGRARHRTLAPRPAASNVLVYTHPAREWNQALPLGNGRLGAMVFGNVNGERIQLNENSLWMGGPRDTNNPDALEAPCRSAPSAVRGPARRGLCGCREIFDGASVQARVVPSLGDLRLTFEHEGTPADYRFELDIDSAIARLSYRLGAVRYTREVFASHPAQAIVMRISADAPAKITVSTWIDRPQDATTEVAGNDRLNLVGALGGGKGLSFLASVKILADGGRLEAYPERIYAQNANALTLIVAAATSYRGNDHRAVGRARVVCSRSGAVRHVEIGSRRRSPEAVPARGAAAR